MLHAALSRTVLAECSLNRAGITDLTWHQVGQVTQPSISPRGDGEGDENAERWGVDTEWKRGGWGDIKEAFLICCILYYHRMIVQVEIIQFNILKILHSACEWALCVIETKNYINHRCCHRRSVATAAGSEEMLGLHVTLRFSFCVSSVFLMEQVSWYAQRDYVRSFYLCPAHQQWSKGGGRLVTKWELETCLGRFR